MVSTLAPEAPTIKPPEKPPAPKPAEKPKPVGEAEVKLVAVIDAKGGVSTPDPDSSLRAIVEAPAVIEAKSEAPGAHIKVDQSAENLARIKALSEVGPERYGASLVETHHDPLPKGDIAAHEAAQAKAYNEDLPKLIEEGLVDPSQIGTEIIHTLGVSATVENPPATHAEIPSRVSQELDDIVSRQLITREEADVIMQEVNTFTQLYQEAYPEATVAQAFELVRNNARTIAYQTNRDKTVFSGSDHGIKHILQGNMRFADQMVASLEAQRVVVTPKDKVLIRQTIIDHDCGYTCGCAQAVSRRTEADGTETRSPGFKASKDHPLFSAKFVEANRDYYVRMFGEEGYRVIQASILNHSYPTELPQQLDPALAIHEDLVRSISSTVDSLGVTAETKTPLFFTNPEAVRVLMRVKLAMDTIGEGKAGKVTIPTDLMESFKAELRAIAGGEQNPDRQAGFLRSIDDFFNEVTAVTTLGHFTGVVDRVSVVRSPDGKLVPQIDMHMSQIHALLGNMFGGDIETQAFVKAMGDFGMTKDYTDRLGAVLAEARVRGIPITPDLLTFVGPGGATFIVSPELADHAMSEFAEIQTAMSEVNAISIRSEINRAIAEISGPDGVDAVPRVIRRFAASVSGKTTEAELLVLESHLSKLTDTSPSGEVDKDGKPITVSEKARTQLKKFLTQNERELLYGSNVTI